ncbi:putative amino acid/polyamine transporter I [Plasmopara halstedii]
MSNSIKKLVIAVHRLNLPVVHISPSHNTFVEQCTAADASLVIMPGSHSHRELGILSVALITYFNVSGGPWGSEPVLAACGPFVGIVSVLLFPWIWCLPLALTFAELFTAFPTDGSFCMWVGVAFGRPMGFQVGYWSWVAGVIDNAIYPCLIVDTLLALTMGDKDALNDENGVAWKVFGLRAVFAVLFMLPTLKSVKVVGHTLLVLGIMIFMPFAVLIINAIPFIKPMNWFVIRKDRDWGRLLSALYWNYSGFDAAGAYAGEIKSPKTTYPKAMILTVFMIAFTYIVPFIAIAGADMPHYTTWDDGSYSVIAQQIGGTWLCVWVLISSIFGNLGLYVAEMAKDGFQLAGMADSGLAPPYFAQRHPDTGVPRRAILLAFFIIIFMGMFDFDTILGIDNFLSALSSLVEMSAAVRMRFSHPEIERPYRVNLSDRSLLLAMILPFTLGVFIMINELIKSWTSFTLNVIALVLGFFIQKYIECHPYHKYSEIIGLSPHTTDLKQEF